MLRAARISFFETFFLSTPFLRIIQMPVVSHSSTPVTYTLGVRGTPNQIDSDVTFSRSCNQGKSQKKD